MIDLEGWGQFFDSPWGWLFLGIFALAVLFGSHEFRDWRHHRRRLRVEHESGFYIDNGIASDSDFGDGGDGDGDDSGDGGGGDGGE